MPVLFIHWLSLRHPRAHFSERRPRLPGQEVPGLGLAQEAGTMLARMAVRLGLGGVAFRPSNFHVAYSARQGLRLRPAGAPGRFEALVRDLADYPLARATQLVADGKVLLGDTPYEWEADEMVYWLRESPAERRRGGPGEGAGPLQRRVNDACHRSPRQPSVKIRPVAVFDRLERAPSGWLDALFSPTTRTGMECP